jgi:archaellum component FlaF (FlaF/FlaG flagellin family)
MGQSTVIATAFTAIMFVAGVSILLMTSISSFDTLAGAITDQAKQNDILLHERVEFGFWTLDDTNTLRINITNSGDTAIMLTKFDTIDLLVSLNNGSDITRWVGFDQDGVSGDYWKITRVFFRDSEGDLVNPMSLTSPVYGGWDPLETIEISINLAEAAPTFQYLSFVTPNGVQTHSSLTVELDYGQVTITAGSSNVTASHDLGRVPDNVQLTAGSSVNQDYWVSSWTNTSFVIEMGSSPVSDVVFFWQVR